MMKHLVLAFLVLSLFACSEDDKDLVDMQETAQQIGDVMASIDEAGGSSGTIASLGAETKTYFRHTRGLPGGRLLAALDWLNPIGRAEAVACKDANTFSACTNNVITRDFNDCTIGLATFSGDVTLTYTDATVDNTCQITTAGHRIQRMPNFTVAGLRNAILTVGKTVNAVNGQVISYVSSGNFSYSNDGLRRLFTVGGTPLYDYTTTTTAPISIAGSSRNNRVMDGGTLRVVNNLAGIACSYTPIQVEWGANCNCAVSGTWDGTCNDGKTSNVKITGCGTGTILSGDVSEDITFDRCYSTN